MFANGMGQALRRFGWPFDGGWLLESEKYGGITYDVFQNSLDRNRVVPEKGVGDGHNAFTLAR